MDSIVIFTDCNGQPEYHLLASKKTRARLAPLDVKYLYEIVKDLEVAIIDCGYNADAGLHLLREIKLKQSSVPVIFLTNVSSEEVVLQAYRLGAREYFKKPFVQAEFIAAVHNLIQFKRCKASWHPVSREDADLNVLFQLPAKLPERLRRVVDHIENNLSAQFILEELANLACMSKYHFCRSFKRHIGLTPHQFLICRRMEKARLLLSKPDPAISLIAFRLGFNDISDFSKQFNKIYGVTPSLFRKAFGTFASNDSNNFLK